MKRIDNILLLISILTLTVIASASTLKTASAQGYAGPYYTVESATNSSTIVMGPTSAVGQTFTATIKLYNVTTSDVAIGVSGIEVHLTWNKTLIEPVSFVNKIGLSGGVLTGPSILYGISPGFYDDAGNVIATAPYTNATHFNVAAASTSGAWWGNGAELAEITFKVDLQPQPFGTCPLALDFSDLADMNAASIAHDQVNATYTILTTSTTPETITFQGVTYPVSIASDSQITAPANMGFQNYTNDGASLTFNVTSLDGFCNVTVPQNFMSGNWNITVDNLAPQSSQINYDSANSYLWFNWSTTGNHVIMLTSSNVVPEFAATSLMLFLVATTLIVTTAATGLKRRKLHR
ncbi:MAG: hypothetical protein ABR962_08005 [Candidatus Bathyarchaeia archaeon]